MKCQQVMNSEVRWVPPTASAAEAAQLMRSESLGFLLVSGDTPGELFGVVTDRDMTARVCAEDRAPARTAISEVATRDVVTCIDTDDLKVAEQKMRESQRSHLVVKDGYGSVVGVLSLTDVVHNDLRWRALETARSVLARDLEVPHQPVEDIHLTASTQEDEDAAMRQETVHGGSWSATMKVFPS